MSQKPGQLAQTCSTIFLVVGILGFETIGSSLFVDPTDRGYNLTRLAVAGVIGAVSSTVGFALGSVIEAIRRRR
jgi:hypothetical protein